jgi:predicted dienelactone hydrolase
MEALAANGYLVIAPNHKDAIGNRSLRDRPDARARDPERWTDATYKDRADDITSLVNALKASPEWERTIEWSQFALVGHSLGGYTVLGLAGAWPRWKLPQVKAVVALSPYAAPYISRRSLDRLGIPVMYQGGTRDIGMVPGLPKGGPAYELTSSPAYYVEFRAAGHFAWTDLTRQSHDSIADYTVTFLNRHVRGDRSADPAKRLSDVADLRVK